MTTRPHDVVIVGAGPAGLECAWALRDSGLRVLVLEQHATVGPKACAGGVTGLAAVDLPAERCRSFAAERYALGPREIVVPVERPFRMIDRRDLGQHQLERLTRCSTIEVRTATRVLAVDASTVTTNRGGFGYCWLVGADGATSLVRRHLGLPTRHCVGLYHELSVEAEGLRFHLDPERLRSGYVWEFPHLGHVNVGVYFDPTEITRATAQRYLADFFARQRWAWPGPSGGGARLGPRDGRGGRGRPWRPRPGYGTTARTEGHAPAANAGRSHSRDPQPARDGVTACRTPSATHAAPATFGARHPPHTAAA